MLIVQLKSFTRTRRRIVPGWYKERCLSQSSLSELFVLTWKDLQYTLWSGSANTYQLSLCNIPCITVSCKTGFSNISIREERKTYEWRIYVWQIQQKYLVFLLLVFAVKLLPVLLHSSWELLTSRCMQWMQIEAMNTNPWENYKMLTTADPSFPFPYLYFQLGAHCFW